jgi:TetR/AcrR family transcriptional regulator, cholesterol catabolism regulator
MVGKSLDQKREHIAGVAVNVFFDKGYKESSLQDISAKAKISKAGIYHYFKSKSDILSYILLGFAKSGIALLIQGLREAHEKKMTQQQILAALINIYAKHQFKNRKMSLIVLRERHQLTAKDRAALLKLEQLIFHTVRDQLRQVPNLNKKLNINIISFQIISMIHWIGYWYDSKGSLSETEAIDQMSHMILHGILD